ncbi:taste receptor type 1 member 1 isoform X2 [Salmo trutta]|uniref:taste receptor type 1 member 1 isoform X2 n=1 Tax=Salmo trutta TaxID=8032 RepID=UPI0011313DB3|nr:taste receptor type 1 member 1-like isoform X2 [Salmo trutta]
MLFLVVMVSFHLMKQSDTCSSLPQLSLDGDYILGGLFQLHENYGVTGTATDTENRKPDVLQCHRFKFSSASYQQIQVMRFAIEEINNSTLLLPGVSLGYEIFDYCSDLLSFGAALDFLTQKGRGAIPVWNGTNYRPKVISVTGPFGSSQTISVAPLYMSEMIPMVTHGASSVQLSYKNRFPSFFRTIPSDKYQVESIVRILRQFNWNWVAFIGGDNDYSRDALTVFQEKIRPANICLAYQDTIPQNQSLIGRLFNNIAMFNVQVIVVFANVEFVIPFIQKAIDLRVKEKVWIASETWSMSQELIKKSQIERIGTVLGVTVQRHKDLRGFDEFINNTVKSRHENACTDMDLKERCGQICSDCNSTSAQTIIGEDPTYSFVIYSAVYAVAHALHNALRCGTWNCANSEIIAYPYMAPVLQCSSECKSGSRKVQTGFHTCCFECEICSDGKYINHTADPYSCIACQKDEWARNGSTSCTKRSIEYLHSDDSLAIFLMFQASSIILISMAILVLFLCKNDTPVVKSAGGRLCFFMLCCLSMSSISVFLYIGKPTEAICTLRNSVFVVFYVACLSCLAVRSFQIVCIFKMAAKLPKAYDFWVKHGGQWITIITTTVIMLFLCILWIAIEGPKPNQIALYSEVILDCTYGVIPIFYVIVLFATLLGIACFSFAYMGTDLPKNYNEGKSITFSLLIFFISWVISLTVHLSTKGKHTLSVNPFSVLCSLYGILFGYFFPKCYIIIITPERNTAAYFQTAIQSYTLQPR